MTRASGSLGVDALLRELAESLASEIDDLVDVMLPRMRAEVPDYDVESSPELRDAERASIVGNVRMALRALASDRRLPESPPYEAIEEARLAARTRMPLETLLHTYRVGHAVVWERVLDTVERMQLDEQSRHAVLKIGSRLMFSYIDAIAAAVTEEYTNERDTLMRSNIQRRVQLIREVLAGTSIGAADLGYDLDAEHLAVVVKGNGADAYLRELEHRLGRRLLSVAVSDDSVWAWLGSPKPLDAAQRKRLAATMPPSDTRAAIGEPGWGAEGFRRSHAEAQAAHRVAERLPRPLTRYDDVALEATLLADERAARRLVERELETINGADERSSKLRCTLEAYLNTGCNAAAAAAMLNVNDRTVAYRIRTIEELLGRSVVTRGAELSAALRLRRLFRQRW
jgi:DNA-binding PucR family transcriptional regulator